MYFVVTSEYNPSREISIPVMEQVSSYDEGQTKMKQVANLMKRKYKENYGEELYEKNSSYFSRNKIILGNSFEDRFIVKIVDI